MKISKLLGLGLLISILNVVHSTRARSIDVIECCHRIAIGDRGSEQGRGLVATINLELAGVDVLGTRGVGCGSTYPNQLFTPLDAFNAAPHLIDAISFHEPLLMINANFFDIAKNPHEDHCTKILGLARGLRGYHSNPGKAHGVELDTMAFFNGRAIMIERPKSNSAVDRIVRQQQNARGQSGPWVGASGIMILKGGVRRNPDGASGHFSWAENDQRTVIGLSESGTEVTVLVVHLEQVWEPHYNEYRGATVEAVQNYLMDQRVSNALMLDGGGSSSLFYSRNGISGSLSLPSDKLPLAQPDDVSREWRPVPVYLVFGRKPPF